MTFVWSSLPTFNSEGCLWLSSRSGLQARNELELQIDRGGGSWGKKHRGFRVLPRKGGASPRVKRERAIPLLDPSFSIAAKTVGIHLFIVCSEPELKHGVFPFCRSASKGQDTVFSTGSASADVFPSSWHSALWGWSHVRCLPCVACLCIPETERAVPILGQNPNGKKHGYQPMILSSLRVMTRNPCESGRRFSHVDKLFWKSH